MTFGFVGVGSSAGLVWAQDSALYRDSSSSGFGWAPSRLLPFCCPLVLPLVGVEGSGRSPLPPEPRFESAALHGNQRGQDPSLISRLGPPSILGHTMESLEIIVLPIVLIGALLLGAIWTNVLAHWLRSTRPLR